MTSARAQDFLNDTGITELTMLWEGGGTAWRINNVAVNSSLQLFSYDLSKESTLLWFNDAGRETVINASATEPWSPAGSTSS